MKNGRSVTMIEILVSLSLFWAVPSFSADDDATVILYDIVESPNPAAVKTFLMNTATEPDGDGDVMVCENGDGQLAWEVLSPASYVTDTVHEYAYRTSISPNDQANVHRFLVVMRATDAGDEAMPPTAIVETGTVIGALVGQDLALFSISGEPIPGTFRFALTAPGSLHVVATNLLRSVRYGVNVSGAQPDNFEVQASVEGIVEFSLEASGDVDIEMAPLGAQLFAVERGKPSRPMVSDALDIPESHPRIWLTEEKLASLQARATAGTPQWTQMINWLNTSMSGEPGYGMEAWHFALAFQATEDIAYVNRAIELTMPIIRQGVEAVTFDQGLYAGERLREICLAYDWGYEFFSPGERDSIVAFIDDVVYWIWSRPDGWGVDDPGNNYYWGFLLGTAYAALGTYHDNADAVAYLSDLLDKLDNRAPDWLDHYGVGGGWHGGANYGQRSKQHMFDLMGALKSCGSADYFGGFSFPEEAGLFHLYSMHPDFEYHHPWGDLAREPSMAVSPYDRHVMLLLTAGLEGTNVRAYLQYWLNHVLTDMGWWDFMFPWDFLLYEPDLVERDFSDLATSFFAEGVGFVNARTSWRESAASFTLVSTDYVQSHQHLDQNHFIFYKSDRLATDGNALSDTGIEQMTRFHCVFLIDGQGQGPWQVARDSVGVITTFEGAGSYSYAAGEAAEAYNYGGTTRLIRFR